MARKLIILKISFLLIIGLTEIACYLAEPDDPDETGLSIRTDAISYSRTDSMTVRFINDTRYTFLLGSSGCVALDDKPLPRLTYERREGGRWIDAGGPACPRVFVPPVDLNPSESYSVIFRAYVSAMEFTPGMYRLRFYFTDNNGTSIPPEEQTYSNTFRLE